MNKVLLLENNGFIKLLLIFNKYKGTLQYYNNDN